MNNNPLVSIIIPVYNGANFVKEAIESALNQSYKSIEVLVIDDGSTDNGETKRAVEPYFDKVRYFEKTNGGVSTALNYGVSKANGDYIAWLSHDDKYPVDKIKNQVDALNTINKDKVIVYGGAQFIDKEGNLEKPSVFSVSRKNTFRGLRHFYPLNVCVASCLFPKAFLLKHPFNEDARSNQDIQQFYTLLKEGYEFHYVKDSIYYGRKHELRVTVTRTDLHDKDVVSFHKILMKYIDETKDYKFAKKYYYFTVEKREKFIVYKDISVALKEYLKKNKKYGIFTAMKSFFVSLRAKFGYFIRGKLLGR